MKLSRHNRKENRKERSTINRRLRTIRRMSGGHQDGPGAYRKLCLESMEERKRKGRPMNGRK